MRCFNTTHILRKVKLREFEEEKMIKNLINILLKYRIWFGVILIFNIMFGVFLWLIDAEDFTYILPTMIIGSVLIYALVSLILYNKEKRVMESIKDFIENPNLKEEEICLNSIYGEEKELIRVIGSKLREKDEQIKEQELNLKEYEEYIETWAHEIKTPLALMTFVLDNRKDEISLPIYQRLEYSRSKMQEDIERMLYYSRVKADHLDYIFSEISLHEICNDVLDEYKNLLEEQKIKINNEVGEEKVVSDKKGVAFVLRQIISNSIKYASKESGQASITLQSTTDKENGNITLKVRDNGIGANTYDLPFLFDKGFTGDTGQDRKKSTGMGLYLSNQIAHSLKFKMEVSEEYKDGFEISLVFPIIE
ncbi:sensor histidine kinase [Clostridium sp. B9]